jgi:hypothetical protein
MSTGQDKSGIIVSGCIKLKCSRIKSVLQKYRLLKC